MKKILILFIGIILLSGCEGEKKPIDDNDYTLSKYQEIIKIHGNRLLKIRRNTCIQGGGWLVDYIHSVDCKCGEVSSLDSAIFFKYVHNN